jgi:hypothetical protein
MEMETNQEEEATVEMIVHYEAECPSLTGRSTLSWALGRDPRDKENTPLLRISRNSGRGMHFKGWAPVAHIEDILAKAEDITARTLNEVHPGRSTNTGGFLVAVLKDLGVVRVKEENTRIHERVPGAGILKAIESRITESAGTDGKNTRKSKAQ